MQQYWYISANDQVLGPLTTDQVRAQLLEGGLKISDLTFRDGETRWQLVGERPDFRDLYTQGELIPDEGLYFRQWIALKMDETGLKGLQEGPYSDAELIAKIQKQEIKREDFLWRPGFSQWARVADLIDHEEGKMRLLSPQEHAVKADPISPSVPYESDDKVLERVGIFKRGRAEIREATPDGVSGGDLAAPGWESADRPVATSANQFDSNSERASEPQTGKSDITKRIAAAKAAKEAKKPKVEPRQNPHRYKGRNHESGTALETLSRLALVVILCAIVVLILPKPRRAAILNRIRAIPRGYDSSHSKAPPSTFENAEVSQLINSVKLGQKLVGDMHETSGKMNMSSTAGTQYTITWMKQVRSAIREIENRLQTLQEASNYSDEWYQTLETFQTLQQQASDFLGKAGDQETTLRADFVSLENRFRGLLTQPPRKRKQPPGAADPQKQ